MYSTDLYKMTYMTHWRPAHTTPNRKEA